MQIKHGKTKDLTHGISSSVRMMNQMVEAAGVEPASEDLKLKRLHA